MSDGLRLALTTFTVLPVRGLEAPDRTAAGRAMSLAPLVGLLLGGLTALLLAGLLELTSPLLAAALAVASLALLTRGLHLDGLADTVDGLASYLPPERARAVMRSPEVGPLGLAAVVLSLLVQVAALATCAADGRGTVALLLATSLARTSVAIACTPAVPAATTDGLGAFVAGTVRTVVPVGWVLVLAAGAIALDGPVPALVAVTAGLAAAVVLLRHAVRRLGGVTGDVLGALVEVTTTVVLVVVACG